MAEVGIAMIPKEIRSHGAFRSHVQLVRQMWEELRLESYTLYYTNTKDGPIIPCPDGTADPKEWRRHKYKTPVLYNVCIHIWSKLNQYLMYKCTPNQARYVIRSCGIKCRPRVSDL